MSNKGWFATLGGVVLLWIAVVITCISGWVTHIVICFQEGNWGFLIAGAIFFPIGIVHGIGRWFGFW